MRRTFGFAPRVVLSALACAFATSGAVPARADIHAQMEEVRARAAWCRDHETNIAQDYAANSDPIDDGGWNASSKKYDRDARGEKNCGEGNSDYANAYLAAWHAQLLHHQGQPWQAELDAADQLLQKCVTQNAGNDRGAKCDRDLKANAQRANAWSGAPTP